MCKEKHDTWIVSQIRELSEMFELVVSSVKDKPEQMVQDSEQRISDGKNISKRYIMWGTRQMKEFFRSFPVKMKERIHVGILRYRKKSLTNLKEKGESIGAGLWLACNNIE